MERKRVNVHGVCVVMLLVILGMVTYTGAWASSGVVIYNQEAAQFEFVGDSSPVVHIDVVDPSMLKNSFTESSILAVTHAHLDHYDKTIVDSFPGKMLVKKAGEISFATGRVVSIPSAHKEGDVGSFLKENASNYIIVVEMNGLKIAHFGDIGQDALTKEQLEKLEGVDIVITQFMNPLSEMDMDNKKAFNLLAQISPKLIIPATHGRFSGEVIQHAKGLWDVYASEELSLNFEKNTLPEKTTMLIWGDGAFFITDEHKIPEWKVKS